MERQNLIHGTQREKFVRRSSNVNFRLFEVHLIIRALRKHLAPQISKKEAQKKDRKTKRELHATKNQEPKLSREARVADAINRIEQVAEFDSKLQLPFVHACHCDTKSTPENPFPVTVDNTGDESEVRLALIHPNERDRLMEDHKLFVDQIDYGHDLSQELDEDVEEDSDYTSEDEHGGGDDLGTKLGMTMWVRTRVTMRLVIQRKMQVMMEMITRAMMRTRSELN